MLKRRRFYLTMAWIMVANLAKASALISGLLMFVSLTDADARFLGEAK
jgi:hypothetical protein